MAELTNEEVNTKCEAAVAKYLAMDEDAAILEISYEVQGWIASRAARGHEVQVSANKILDLIMVILATQQGGLDGIESEVVKRYQEQGGKL